jgi:hypothetical protein
MDAAFYYKVEISPLFFRLRLGYMLVTASGISNGPRSATESKSRSSTMERTSSSEIVGVVSDSADCPPFSYHAHIAELTRLFFSGGSSAPRRRPEHATYGSGDFSSTTIGRNVEEDRLLTEHAYVSRSSSRSIGHGSRGIKKGTLRKSAINPIGDRAAQNIFDELHNMCCQSSFPSTSKNDVQDPTQLEPSDFAEFGRTKGPTSVEKFLASEFEMPSRTFIAFLRVRVSPNWAALVQKLVDGLSAAAGVLGGIQVADTCGGLLEESDRVDVTMDLGSVQSSCMDHTLSGIPGVSGDSPENNRILDLLRAGAKVRVVDRNAFGGTLSRHSSEGVNA